MMCAWRCAWPMSVTGWRGHRVGDVRGARCNPCAARSRTNGRRAVGGRRDARLCGSAAHLPGCRVLRDGQLSTAYGKPPLDDRPVRNLCSLRRTFVLAIGNDKLWSALCTNVGLPELAADPRFATNIDRVVHRQELNLLLEARFSAAPRAHWLDVLTQAGIPCGAVRTVGETLEDSQLTERDMIVELEHRLARAIKVLGTPIKLSRTPGSINTPPPILGEHTEAILREVGYDTDTIEALKAAGAV